MHRSSDADIRAWGASTAVDSDEEDEGQERFGTEVLEQQRLLHSGSTPHAARERHSVGSAAWANALYQRRAVRKGAQDRRALLVACCVLLGLGFGYALAGRWQRVGSGPNAAARVEAQLQPEAAARSAAPRLGPPPTIDPARWKHVLNESLQWADASVPAFECSDDDVTLTYWYRWRLFHLHMRRGDKLSACSSPRLGCWVRTSSPATRCSRGCNPVYARLQPRAVKAATPFVHQVLTEFLRKVFWSGPHNTIVAPAGHHIMEGRWLRDDSIIDDYARFWRTRHGGSAPSWAHRSSPPLAPASWHWLWAARRTLEERPCCSLPMRGRGGTDSRLVHSCRPRGSPPYTQPPQVPRVRLAQAVHVLASARAVAALTPAAPQRGGGRDGGALPTARRQLQGLAAHTLLSEGRLPLPELPRRRPGEQRGARRMPPHGDRHAVRRG